MWVTVETSDHGKDLLVMCGHNGGNLAIPVEDQEMWEREREVAGRGDKKLGCSVYGPASSSRYWPTCRDYK